jgi:hypothetical protein
MKSRRTSVEQGKPILNIDSLNNQEEIMGLIEKFKRISESFKSKVTLRLSNQADDANQLPTTQSADDEFAAVTNALFANQAVTGYEILDWLNKNHQSSNLDEGKTTELAGAATYKHFGLSIEEES